MRTIRNIIALIILSLLAVAVWAHIVLMAVLQSKFVPQSTKEAWGITLRLLNKIGEWAND